MNMLKLFAGIAAGVTVASLACAASAGPIPYPTPGTPNPVVSTFTATSTGEITAYFAGSGASYDEEVGMLVNGVPTGVVGLDDHSSAIGLALNLGAVTAGDTLTFFDDVSSINTTWYSDPTLNTADDGGNHVYSTDATAGQVFAGSPAGVYVGFEDLNFISGSDYNYFDDTFVFTNTTLAGGVPEPATWALMLMGVGMIGAGVRLARRKDGMPVRA